MKKRVAILEFPGTNSEHETARAVEEAGMDAVLFRWNEDPAQLDSFDGFVLPGGFSYEDRGRAGLVASMDSIMKEIRVQAHKGKPVLGICNGAQILVETGLIPGAEDDALLMSLARNKRMRKGQLLGVGFYNEDIHVIASAPQGRCAFTLDFAPGDIDQAPVAHGEGRFTSSIPGLLEKLRENQQIVFRYCTSEGEIDPDFPINPNGAIDNAAAICNPRGNVMAIMPHPERAPKTPMPKIFSSMRKYMEGMPLTAGGVLPFVLPKTQPQQKVHEPNTIDLYVKLLITDNEAQTIENALRHQGIDVRINKWVLYEVEHEPLVPGDQLELAHALVNCGELLNTNKEKFTFVLDGMSFPKKDEALYFLSRDKEDSVGLSKLAKLRHYPGMEKLKSVRHAWFWEVQGKVTPEQILGSNVFANPHAQDLFLG